MYHQITKVKCSILANSTLISARYTEKISLKSDKMGLWSDVQGCFKESWLWCWIWETLANQSFLWCWLRNLILNWSSLHSAICANPVFHSVSSNFGYNVNSLWLSIDVGSAEHSLCPDCVQICFSQFSMQVKDIGTLKDLPGVAQVWNTQHSHILHFNWLYFLLLQRCSTKHHQIVQPLTAKETTTESSNTQTHSGEELQMKQKGEDTKSSDLIIAAFDTPECCWAHDLLNHDYFLNYRVNCEGKTIPNSHEVCAMYYKKLDNVDYFRNFHWWMWSTINLQWGKIEMDILCLFFGTESVSMLAKTGNRVSSMDFDMLEWLFCLFPIR